MNYEIRDPRFLPGNIAGFDPDDPFPDMDPRHAIILTRAQAVLFDHDAPEQVPMALLASGTIYGTTESVRTAFLLSPDAAAGIMAGLGKLAARLGPEFAGHLMDRVEHLVLPERGSPPGAMQKVV